MEHSRQSPLVSETSSRDEVYGQTLTESATAKRKEAKYFIPTMIVKKVEKPTNPCTNGSQIYFRSKCPNEIFESVFVIFRL